MAPKLSPSGSAWASSINRQFPVTYSHISLQNIEKQEDNKLTK